MLLTRQTSAHAELGVGVASVGDVSYSVGDVSYL